MWHDDSFDMQVLGQVAKGFSINILPKLNHNGYTKVHSSDKWKFYKIWCDNK